MSIFFKFIFMLHASHIGNNTVCSCHALTQWNLVRPYNKKRKVEPIPQIVKPFSPSPPLSLPPLPLSIFFLFSLSISFFLSLSFGRLYELHVFYVDSWCTSISPYIFFYFLWHVIISLTLSLSFFSDWNFIQTTHFRLLYIYWHQTKLIVFFTVLYGMLYCFAIINFWTINTFLWDLSIFVSFNRVAIRTLVSLTSEHTLQRHTVSSFYGIHTTQICLLEFVTKCDVLPKSFANIVISFTSTGLGGASCARAQKHIWSNKRWSKKSDYNCLENTRGVGKKNMVEKNA